MLPIDAVSASMYICYLKESGAAIGAIKSAFNAFKWAHNFVPGLNKFNDPLETNTVKRVFESALRSIKPGRNIKAPLTKDLIKLILANLKADSSLKEIRNATIISLAHNLLLRHDEIAHLCCSHMEVESDHVRVTIISSKTDKLRNGKNVLLSKAKDEDSSYQLLLRYMVKAHLSFGQNHFLFGPLSGHDSILNQKLSYACYRQILRSAVESIGADPSNFGFHSCRSGGATDLASSLTPFELLSAGRWQSQQSLAHYVEIPKSRKLQWSSFLNN